MKPLAAELDLANISQHGATALLLFVRIVPVVWLAPFLSLRRAPGLVSLAIAAALTVCLLPAAAAAGGSQAPTGPELLPLALREAAIGAVYGLALALPLLALGWAGLLADRLRGVTASLGESALEKLYLWLGIALFFAVGGHRVALRILGESLATWPIGAVSALPDARAIALGSVELFATALLGAITIALPVAISLLLAELLLSLIARGAALAPLSAILPGGRALLGIAVVLMGLPVLLQRAPRAFAASLEAASQLLR